MSKLLFKELRAINVNGHTETVKQGNATLTYLSWAWAVDEVSKSHDFAYQIKWFDGKPYLRDERLGYMVFTEVTVDGVTKEMWLPVMDSHNKAMKDEPYQVKTRNGVFTVPACTMFDVNKAIMRCLTKNLAMFGLGLYIYAGEDLPDVESAETAELKADVKEQLLNDIYAIYQQYPNSKIIKRHLKSATEHGKVAKVGDLSEKELSLLKGVIEASINQIKEENEDAEPTD